LVWATNILKYDDLELILVPDIGGRLMDVKYKGISLLFQNPDLLSYLPDLTRLAELPSRAKHLSFPLWGGEKTWIAPDVEWPDGAPHSALDSGAYAFESNDSQSASMHSPICPKSYLQINRTIDLRGSGHWTIRHQVVNKGLNPRLTGIWSVMMTRAPASYLFRPVSGDIPKTVFGEPKMAFNCYEGIGQINCDERREFKLGIHPAKGITAARIPTSIGTIWIVNTGCVLKHTDEYAHGHALEFYNSGHYNYGELEWHSPAAYLQPDQSYEFELGYKLIMEDNNYSAVELFKRIESQFEDDQ